MATSENTVLVQIVTAANLAGIEQAKASLLGFNASTLGLAAGLGVLYAATKSAIDISEGRANAEADLASAIADRNKMDQQANDPKAVANVQKAQENLAKAQQALGLEEDRLSSKRKLTKADLDELKIKNDAVRKAEDELAQASAAVSASHQAQRYDSAVLQQQVTTFIKTNRDYTDSQNDVIDGFAAFVREGIPAKDIQEAMNAALDISISEHIPLSQAILMVQGAESGRAAGLRKLVGIQLENVSATATEADKLATAKHNLDLVSAAYDGARNNVTPLQRKVNDLNNDWQDLANNYGPAVVTELDLVAGALNGVYQKMVDIGNDNDFWAKLQNLLINNLLPLNPATLQAEAVAAKGGSSTGALSSSAHARPNNDLSTGKQMIPGPTFTTYISGASDPAATARAVQRVLRNAMNV